LRRITAFVSFTLGRKNKKKLLTGPGSIFDEGAMISIEPMRDRVAGAA
jgi:hypothetical protein